ncbi:hypothetical protein P7K49_024721, partial [Saguinus oedipus]
MASMPASGDTLQSTQLRHIRDGDQEAKGKYPGNNHGSCPFPDWSRVLDPESIVQGEIDLMENDTVSL